MTNYNRELLIAVGKLIGWAVLWAGIGVLAAGLIVMLMALFDVLFPKQNMAMHPWQIKTLMLEFGSICFVGGVQLGMKDVTTAVRERQMRRMGLTPCSGDWAPTVMKDGFPLKLTYQFGLRHNALAWRSIAAATEVGIGTVGQIWENRNGDEVQLHYRRMTSHDDAVAMADRCAENVTEIHTRVAKKQGCERRDELIAVPIAASNIRLLAYKKTAIGYAVCGALLVSGIVNDDNFEELMNMMQRALEHIHRQDVGVLVDARQTAE